MRQPTGVDLLLVNPGSRNRIYQLLGDELTAIENPVWAGLIATYVRTQGFSVEVLDANAENMTPENVAIQVADIDPFLVVVVVYGHQPSASTQTMPAAGAICAAIKANERARKTLLLGGHVSALPKRTLHEEKVDFVAGGEGLVTVVDLLNVLKSDETNNYEKVAGLWYKDEKGIMHSNPAPPLITDLNREIPGIGWDLFPMEAYRAHNWHCFGGIDRKPYAAMYTTLGCPYHCTFCCIQAPFKPGEQKLGYREAVNSYRFWRPEVVISQIDQLVREYGVRNIKIADEMFVLNPRHVMHIADLLIERGYELNIWAYARVDTVKEEMLDKLKKAGFNWLGFGIESASERVRDEVAKGFKQEKIFKTLERVRANGINVAANYIFGLPEDDWASMEGTLELALELNTEWANFYCAMAYPGSALYTRAVKEGWRLPVHWSGYSQHAVDTLPLSTKYLSGSEILRFRDYAFERYFTSKKYLDLISQKFGPSTVDHIRWMTSYKLERRYA